jgi:hypothetical protein
MSVRQRFNIPRDFNEPRPYPTLRPARLYPDKRPPFEPCSEASAAAALEAVGVMFGEHGEDAKTAMVFSAVSGWHSRKTGRWGHNAASALAFDANSRMIGRVECLTHKTPDERAALIAEAEAALAEWRAEGCPGLLLTINNMSERLLAKLEEGATE